MRYVWIFTLAIMSACGDGPVASYGVPQPVVEERISISFASVELRDVSLPSYAASDEIHVEGPGGALQSSASVLWADNPARAVSLELSRNLSQLTGAKIANEPWPFESFPQARVEVRIEDMVASAAGQFRLKGQYFVAATRGRRERSALFDLAVPYDAVGGPVAIAAARGQVILDLSRAIARDGLR